jgi:hypothetical protein
MECSRGRKIDECQTTAKRCTTGSPASTARASKSSDGFADLPPRTGSALDVGSENP